MTQTVHAAFTASAERRGAADCLWVEPVTAAAYGIVSGALSWNDVAAEAERLRAAYQAAGYGHGHRVGLLLENRPAFFAHWLALNALGASVVPISSELQGGEWGYLVAHSEMCLAVTLPEREAGLRSAASQAGVTLATMRPEAAGKVPTARTPPPLAHTAVSRNSECALLYTAGTAGKPKGCRLSNGYFLRTGEWYLGLGELATIRPDVERILTPLPLSHMNAMAFSAMAAFLSGGCLVQLDRLHPRSWWDSVRESGATIVHDLGLLPARLLAAPPSPNDRDHAVRFGFSGSIPREQHAAFEERFGFPLLEAWSMTEAGGAACIVAHREPRWIGTQCFGRAGNAIETRVVEPEGHDAADGFPGELLLRAAGPVARQDFFLDYLKDPAATEEAWAGGWFHTGDVVLRSGEGDFHFVDRKKNVIRRGGESISAVEVEGVLAQHPSVAACAVAATPDKTRGDEVLACVVLKPEARDLDPIDIAVSLVAFALERMAYFKAPAYVAFVEHLPLTVARKIQRADLKELAKKLPSQPNCIDTRALKRRRRLK